MATKPKQTATMKGEAHMNAKRQAATNEGGKMTHSRKTARGLIATIIIAALALVSPAAPSVYAAGLRNCVDVTGPGAGEAACYEIVWANGVQFTMTFANQGFTGGTPSVKQDVFYVVAPQTGTPQGTLPFLHDHVVRDVPPQNHGVYSVQLHGYFVLCSEQGIAGGGCVPTMASIQGLGILPLAKTANGQALTSVGPIESGAASGLITLFDTGAVLVATINPGK